jgi:hypothetical protein
VTLAIRGEFRREMHNLLQFICWLKLSPWTCWFFAGEQGRFLNPYCVWWKANKFLKQQQHTQSTAMKLQVKTSHKNHWSLAFCVWIWSVPWHPHPIFKGLWVWIWSVPWRPHPIFKSCEFDSVLCHGTLTPYSRGCEFESGLCHGTLTPYSSGCEFESWCRDHVYVSGRSTHLSQDSVGW